MTLFVAQAQSLLDRFEAKRKAAGLEFTPPDARADLGRYAFPADVFQEIYLGVATGLLTEVVKYIFCLSLSELERRRSKSDQDSKANDPANLIREIKASAKISEEAIQKLRDQGVKADQAKAAIELLVETIGEELAVKGE